MTSQLIQLRTFNHAGIDVAFFFNCAGNGVPNYSTLQTMATPIIQLRRQWRQFWNKALNHPNPEQYSVFEN
jgi:hypothetical protein